MLTKPLANYSFSSFEGQTQGVFTTLEFEGEEKGGGLIEIYATCPCQRIRLLAYCYLTFFHLLSCIVCRRLLNISLLMYIFNTVLDDIDLFSIFLSSFPFSFSSFSIYMI